MSRQFISIFGFLLLGVVVFVFYYFNLFEFVYSKNNSINTISRLINNYDSLDREGDFRSEILVKENGSKKYLLISQNDNPISENIDKTFIIKKNSGGRTIMINQIIQAESGDENIVESFYFDLSENTIAYKVRITFFSNDCAPNGIAIKWYIGYYNQDFKSIFKKEFILN